MIKTIFFIILVTLCLISYTLWIKKAPKTEENFPSQVVQTTQKIEPIQETNNEIKQERNQTKTLPKIKKNDTPSTKIPNVELKYYNLAIEKDYYEYYNNTSTQNLEPILPPLTKEEIEEQSDFNINLTPEINYNKETKEISIDGVQIQLEKKF